MGPFNYLGSCCALEERRWYEMRNHGLLRLRGKSVGKTLRKIAIGEGDANLKEQVCAILYTAHLLFLTIRFATRLLTLASADVEAIRFPSRYLAS